ncbi:ImmA/IrrE family metallo-endopeptidase [Streptomyces sp. NPDC052042]|uniref:ImmA/IrrE family metallo-endopeptidase n=1 Tax=Streptomyces sp. NPDC052042 TaxID=3365683 RepID=UPI0037D77E25
MRSLGLPLDDELSVEELCEHIGKLRQRPLRVVSLALPSDPRGLWVSTDTHDYIFVEENLVPVHQQQVILHEIGHLLCDHKTSAVLPPEASRLLFPSLAPGTVRRILGRQHSDSVAEIEAELVGSMIGQLISTWTPRRELVVPQEAREIAERLALLEAPKPGK